MLRDAIYLAVGFGAGWLFFERPQFITNAWQWIKHKFGGGT